MTDKVRFLKKKFWRLEFGPNEPKSGARLSFLPFSQVWFITFPEIWYNDKLQQCLTSCRGKIHEKLLGGLKFGPKGPKLGLKLSFLPFSQVWFISFLLNCIG